MQLMQELQDTKKPEMNKDFKLLPKFKQNGFDNNYQTH